MAITAMRCRATVGALALVAVGFAPASSKAGNDANFVLYNQHTEEKGETEIELFSDLSSVGGDEKNYTAQLVEVEYGVTDLWTTALYLEGVRTNGEDYDFGSGSRTAPPFQPTHVSQSGALCGI